MTKLKLSEIQQIELEILKFFHQFCEENNLCYSIAFGTLLGAIRHKGFIPWDDDIDVVMPRNDYEMLKKFFKNTKLMKGDKGNFCLISNNENKHFPYTFMKIYDNRTLLNECIIDEGLLEKYPMGVYIDIFPLDGITDMALIRNIKMSILHLFHKLRVCKVIQIQQLNLDNGRKKIFCLLKKIIPQHSLLIALSEAICKQGSFEKSQYIGVFCSGNKKNIMHKQWIDRTIDVEFEKYFFKAPVESHAVLTAIYGDYMKLPPIEQQKTHHGFDAFKK